MNVYKGKGDALDRSNYRALKLLYQVMRVMEIILEDMIRERVNINEMQLGFMQGRGATDAIFIVRQLQEKYLVKKRELHLVSVDLEKSFDRVLREVLQWVMRKMVVEKCIVTVAILMHESDEFKVNDGVHQSSFLSHLFFIMV